MNFRELLKLINFYAASLGLPKTYIVGGVPRDKLLGNLNQVKDIDLTNGSYNIKNLAAKVNEELDYLDPKSKSYPDGHISMKFGNLSLDFSSNFIIQNLEKITGKTLNPLEQEVYSRDFTCNTLLWDLELKDIKDLTGRGKKDIKAKKLETCLAPEITLGVDPKRVGRLFYLAAKLDFEPSEDIKSYLKSHPELQVELDQNYLFEKLSSAYVKNKEKTLELLSEIGWEEIKSAIDIGKDVEV